jgi:cytochrome c biogenesis protein CcmG, thiol:disulfide interchange protein DsbE
MMTRRSLLVALPLLAFAGLAGLFVWGLQRDNPKELNSALLGKPAPAFALPGLDGKPGLATADLATGKPVLVNFFASWCAPCIVEHPYLIKLTRDHNLTVYAIAYKDDPKATQALLTRLGNPFSRIGVDRDGKAAIDWGIAGVPETFVVDSRGRIVHRQWGPVTTDDQLAQLVRIVEGTR